MAGYQLRVTIPTETKDRLHRFMEKEKRPESNATDYLLEKALDLVEGKTVKSDAHVDA
jgi:hypothetical protein